GRTVAAHLDRLFGPAERRSAPRLRPYRRGNYQSHVFAAGIAECGAEGCSSRVTTPLNSPHRRGNRSAEFFYEAVTHGDAKTVGCVARLPSIFRGRTGRALCAWPL